MIVVELTEREARSLANIVDMMRGALDDARETLGGEAGTSVLEVAHSKLVVAIERGEEVAI
jgi:hypothetical protein